DGIRDFHVTGVQTCALPIYRLAALAQGIQHPFPLQLLEHGAKLALQMRRVSDPEAIQPHRHLIAEALAELPLEILTQGSMAERQIGSASCRERVKGEPLSAG